VISDLHYAEARNPAHPKRYCEQGCRLAGEAIDRARRLDAIALLGDFLDDGTREGSLGRLVEIRDRVRTAAGDVPLLAVPGNHDGPYDRVFEAFDTRPGLHEIGGYRFVAFADPYAPGDFCTRRDEDLDFPLSIAARPGGPIVALQHGPINPPVHSADYPYMHTNRQEIMDRYSTAGVLLSLSGHYHKGQPLNLAGGVWYFTVPALVEPPFRYAIVTLQDREVSIEPGQILPADSSP